MVHFNSRRSIIKCDTDENFGALMERLEVNLGSETVAEVTILLLLRYGRRFCNRRPSGAAKAVCTRQNAQSRPSPMAYLGGGGGGGGGLRGLRHPPPTQK